MMAPQTRELVVLPPVRLQGGNRACIHHGHVDTDATEEVVGPYGHEVLLEPF